VPYPTTLILLAVIGAVALLGWNGTLDGQAVSATLSSVVAAVTVGHYVKTTHNGIVPATPGTTVVTSTTVPGEPPAEKEKDTL
jgi:hypothetical protein